MSAPTARMRAWLRALRARRPLQRRPVQVAGVALALLCLAAAALAMHDLGGRGHRKSPARRVVALAITATASVAFAPTATPIPPTDTASATAPPTDTATPTGTATPSATPTPPPTDTPLPPSATRTPAPSRTPTALPSQTPTALPTRTATATAPPPVPVLSTATPIPAPTVDPVYYAADTLAGTGPGPDGPLSGLPTRPIWADRRPVAVVIDNYAPDARPQTGLNRASLVFETLAEGGITRLMAVYLERDAPVVGPVRSARIYFNAWAAGLKAIYAHAGGNSDALYQLGTGHLGGVANIDDLNLPVAPNANDDPYWRSDDRYAPHNLYTSTYALRAYTAQAGRPAYGNFGIGLPHRVPDSPFHRGAVAWIDVGFSSYDYNVHWTYDRAANTYLRSVGGISDRDAISHRQIAASNVVVLFTRETPDHDPFAPDGVNMHTQGTGRALYFRDGHLVIGSWHKRSILAPLQLLDHHGKPQQFNPGQTWIEVVPEGAPVTYHGT